MCRFNCAQLGRTLVSAIELIDPANPLIEFYLTLAHIIMSSIVRTIGDIPLRLVVLTCFFFSDENE